MDAIGKELESNRAILDAGIRDQEQWAQNVEGYMRGLPKPGSMSEAALILIRSSCDNKWVSMEHLKKVPDHMQKRIQKMFMLQSCPLPSSTDGQQALMGWFRSSCG